MVLKTFLAQNYEIGFCIEMIDLTVLLLCFLSPYKAVHVLQGLYKEVLPQEIYPGKLMQGKNFKGINERISVHFLDIFRGNYGVFEHGFMEKLMRYFSNFGLQFLMSFCVMRVNFGCSYYLLNTIIKEKQELKFKCLKKAYISISHLNLEVIKAFNFSYDQNS